MRMQNIVVACVMLTTGALASAVAAQSEPPAIVETQAGPVTTGPKKTMLLREGSFLSRARGTMERDARSGLWKLVLDRTEMRWDSGTAPQYELLLLPCSLLSEMERLVSSIPDQSVLFEVSGQVYVYRGRNYLLPTNAPRLASHPSKLAPAETPAEPEVAEAAPAEDNAESDAESAEEIMRQLERSIGPVVKSSATGEGSAAGTTPSRPYQPEGADAQPALQPQTDLSREGAIALWRRGYLSRDSSGAWVFVFEADAAGLADPPVTLLPCLVVERLETIFRQPTGPVAILLNGQVTIYRGRTYLLPSAFQIPRESRPRRPGDRLERLDQPREPQR